MFKCLLLCLVACGVVVADTDQAPGTAPMAALNKILESMNEGMARATLPAHTGPMEGTADAPQERQTSDASCGPGSPCEDACKKEPSCGCKHETCKCCDCKPCQPCPPCPVCPPCPLCPPCPPCPRCQECKPCKPKCKCQGPSCSQCSEDAQPAEEQQNVAFEAQTS